MLILIFMIRGGHLKKPQNNHTTEQNQWAGIGILMWKAGQLLIICIIQLIVTFLMNRMLYVPIWYSKTSFIFILGK